MEVESERERADTTEAQLSFHYRGLGSNCSRAGEFEFKSRERSRSEVVEHPARYSSPMQSYVNKRVR